jgi:asparagine synthase (glutamine-hydrolysing)
MCGMAGFADWSDPQTSAEARARFPGVSGDVHQRGPDRAVFVADRHFSAVHARLALVGPATGGQPIASEDGRRYVLFVGEIYNWKELASSLEPRHRFLTGSDGEVLLHGYEEEGAAFFRRVDGMFAVALRDLDLDVLVLARDRLGIKPLFVGREASRVAFGTDVKSVCRLLRRRPELNWTGALQMIGQPSRASANCWVGIEEVEPGTARTFRAAGGEVWRWHRFARTDSGLSGREVATRYAGALKESIERQTRDLESAAVALSGGVDSSLICALSPCRPEAFVLVNESTVKNGEVTAAQVVSKQLGIPLVEVRLRTAADAAIAYAAILRFCETPDVRSEHLLKDEVARAVAAAGHRVVLSGQGSDEFNGGYSGLGAGDGPRLALYLQRAVHEELHAERLLASGIRGDLAPFLSRTALDFLGEPVFPDPWEQELHRRVGMLRRYNLLLDDRVGGGHGLENRVPFLGNAVVGWAWAVPPEAREALLTDKEILRRLADQVLLPAIARRPKVAFFHGESAGATFRYLTAVLLQKPFGGESLVEMARQTPALNGRGPLARDAFDHLARLAAVHPAHEAVEALAGLVNLALLSEPGFMDTGPASIPPEVAYWFGSLTASPDQGGAERLPTAGIPA